jgi:hypothetical protein
VRGWVQMQAGPVTKAQELHAGYGVLLAAELSGTSMSVSMERRREWNMLIEPAARYALTTHSGVSMKPEVSIPLHSKQADDRRPSRLATLRRQRSSVRSGATGPSIAPERGAIV